jgi:hypothetical protein
MFRLEQTSMNGLYGLIQDSDLRSILLEQSKAMPAEYSAVVDRRFWELIGDSDADRRDSGRRDCADNADNGGV